MSKADTRPVPVIAIAQYLRSPESQGQSDREIALHLNTQPKEIARIRKQIERETSADSPDVPDPQASPEPSASNGEESSPAADTADPEPASPSPPASSGMVLPGKRTLRLDQLDVEAGTMVRPLSDRYVDDYVNDLKAAKTTAVFPDLEAFWVGELDPPRYVLTSGFHRRQAALEVFGPTVVLGVDVKVGTLREAKAAAYRHNRKHGYRLTTDDRRRIVESILADPEWGQWNNVRIAQLAGEEGDTGRLFVGEVRKAWHEKTGTPMPEKTKYERDGKTYEQKATQDHPRGKADASEGDAVDASDSPDGGDLTPAERKAEIDRQYLESIPCREHLHPDLLGDFDQDALAYRELTGWFATAGNWVNRHRDSMGEDNPVFVPIEKITKIGRPWGGLGPDTSPPWVACEKCAVSPDADAIKVSTGFLEGKPCPKCKSMGYYPRTSR